MLLPKKEQLEVQAYMPHFVFAPVQMGERGGYFEVYCGDECIATGNLLYASSVEAKK